MTVEKMDKIRIKINQLIEDNQKIQYHLDWFSNDDENDLDARVYFDNFDTRDLSKKQYDDFYRFADSLRVENEDYITGVYYDCSGFDYWTYKQEESNYISIWITIKNYELEVDKLLRKIFVDMVQPLEKKYRELINSQIEKKVGQLVWLDSAKESIGIIHDKTKNYFKLKNSDILYRSLDFDILTKSEIESFISKI